MTKSDSPAMVSVYTLDGGLTEFAEASIFSDTGEYDGKSVALPAACYLIHHGDEWMLWDTGLNDKSAAEPNGVEDFGGRFTVRRTLAAQLAELGLRPDDVGYVAMSHLHKDHTGNMGLFPNSVFLIGAPELAWARGNPTPFGVDPSEFSVLDQANVSSLDDDQDVFGDGTVVILKTPGHTPGGQSLLVKLGKSGVLLITGDLYHTRENYYRGSVPHGNDRAQTLASMDRFARITANTHARVTVQHDPEDFASMPVFPKYLD